MLTHYALPLPFAQCVRLYNLRSRMGAWNQLRTTYLRHSNANFQQQLKNAKNADEYIKLISGITEDVARNLMLQV